MKSTGATNQNCESDKHRRCCARCGTVMSGRRVQFQFCSTDCESAQRHEDEQSAANERTAPLKPRRGRPPSSDSKTVPRMVRLTAAEAAADDAARGTLPWAEWDRRARESARKAAAELDRATD